MKRKLFLAVAVNLWRDHCRRSAAFGVFQARIRGWITRYLVVFAECLALMQADANLVTKSSARGTGWQEMLCFRRYGLPGGSPKLGKTHVFFGFSRGLEVRAARKDGVHGESALYPERHFGTSCHKQLASFVAILLLLLALRMNGCLHPVPVASRVVWACPEERAVVNCIPTRAQAL